MANRRFQRTQAIEREVKQIHVEWKMVAGAPEIVKAMGVESVELTAAGDFRVTLQDKYNRLMGVQAMLKSATPADFTVQLKDETVATDKTVDVFTLTAGVETTPADDDSVIMTMWLKNTSVVN